MIWGGWPSSIADPKLAVDLFMMISGFLMVAQADARSVVEPLRGTRNRWRFWARRLFRVAPAYYLSLLLAVVSAPLFLEGYTVLRGLNQLHWQFDTIYDPARIEYTVRNIVLHLTFVFGLMQEASASTMLPDWSLSLEMQFYAVFPLLLAYLNRMGITATALLGLVAAWVGWQVYGFYEPSLLVFKLHHFVAGMLIFRARSLWTCACAIALSALDGSTVPPAMATALLVAVHFESIGRLPAAFNSAVVRFASDASYSVYLFHGFFIAASGLAIAHVPLLGQLAPRERVMAMILFVAAGSYAIAWAVFRWIETPGIELGRRLTDRVVARSSPTVVPSLTHP